jgi:AcrR family transcriptional regulator
MTKRKRRSRLASVGTPAVAAADLDVQTGERRSSTPRRKPTRLGRPVVKARNVQQRQAIAEAALKLFSKFGFVQVTNNEIGELADVNPALIYYYFKDREDLFQFVVRKALDDALSVYKSLSREPGAAGGLGAWLSSNLLLSEEISRFLKIVLDYAHSERQSHLTDDAIARFYRAEIEILANALRNEIGFGSARATDLAQLVSVLLDGVMVARVVRPEMDIERIVNLMRELLRSGRS